MSKKKRKSPALVEGIPISSEHDSTTEMKNAVSAPDPTSGSGSTAGTSSLVICRNKHWRYISSFHGPWLQLPPEVLDSLVSSNLEEARPRPIDPAVFSDIAKIRKLVEEATDLAVRAANGTTSSTLSMSANATNGMLHGGSAAALGIQLGNGAQHATLSRERRNRMRENATQKLAMAYQLDEIAASVATMQSASALEEVASLILQRDQSNFDAKYVHFFHEKIPSRALAESTSLQPLTEIIRHRSSEPAIYKTRGIMHIFKDDLPGAIRDFSDGLSVLRLYRHEPRQPDLDSSRQDRSSKTSGPSVPSPEQRMESSHTGIEIQLLFHRAGTYLTLACDHIEAGLQDVASAPLEASPARTSAALQAVEARRLVKTYAKRALRDYMTLLSYLDYSPTVKETPSETHRRMKAAEKKQFSSMQETRFEKEQAVHDQQNTRATDGPASAVFQLSSLFSAAPPKDLPPFPPTALALVPRSSPQAPMLSTSPSDSVGTGRSLQQGVLTYHPFLIDALHALLLCHCLVQTSTKELLRHAYMVARLVHICDGYPIFLAARSPARADWLEVVRRTNNWIGLQSPWETLCSPVPSANHSMGYTTENNQQNNQQLELRQIPNDSHKEVEMRAKVRQREIKAARDEEEEQRKEYLRAMRRPVVSRKNTQGKRWIQKNDDYLPESVERAELIACWVRDAPPPGSDLSSGSVTKKPRKRRPKARAMDAVDATGSPRITDDVQKLLADVNISKNH